MSKLPTSRLPVTPSKTGNAPKSGLRPPQQTSTSVTTSQQINPSAGDSSNNSLSMGDRVTANGKTGTIAFIGPTKFADGEWIGIILDEAQGKNDGSYEGIRYFETEANRGLFCRPAKVQRLVQNGANNVNVDDTSSSIKAQTTPLADSSKISTSNNDADTTLVNNTITSTNTTTNDQTIVSVEPSTTQELRVGDRVVVSGTKFGTLKYLGKIHVADGTWCGIQLDEPLGKNDGSVSGKRYFTCQQRYGLFSPLARVEKVSNDMSQSQIIARKASVSSSTNNKNQLHRSTSQESLHSNLSEFSASSNSISRIPTRTPAKLQQQKLATNANLYTTPNTKYLLTQAAATLAAVTPSSNQVSTLIQTIREKDIIIEKLQTQCEQDRLEFSRAAQQVDEMENRMLTFKQQYDIKELENEQLKKDEYQTKQRIEDLEFQLEEYKLTDSNKEHSNTTITPIIPDGHRLLTPKDIEIYEEIKSKVLEFETINQKLILEKQTLQDEYKQELKKQNELNENEYKSRLNEFEQKYNDNLKTKQSDSKSEYEEKLKEKNQLIEQLKSQITDLQNKEQNQSSTLSEKETFYQSKLEQSTKETEELRSQFTTLQQEKDKQTNDLLVELKRYQENLLPELEKQCQTLKSELTDLQNRDRNANLALNERESQYEQQVKEYQSNLNQAVQETAKIRNELEQIQKENHSKEEQFNTLKQDYDKLQIEIKQQEQKSISILNESEKNLKNYQIKFDQSNSQIENLQSELKKIQEEKSLNEKQLNTIKQDYEKLQIDFKELQDRDRTQNMALNEREIHYETQIKEYQTKRDQTLQEIQELRNELTKNQEENLSKDKQLNIFKENYEKFQIEFNQQEQKLKEYQNQSNEEIEKHRNELKQKQEENLLKEQQIQTLKTQINELENQNQIKTEKHQQIIDNYQTKLDQLNQENNNLRQQIEENNHKINQLQKEFNEKNQLSHQTENLQKDYQDLQQKYSDIQIECQKHLTSNEQLKNTNDNIVNEKQALIDQLKKQIQDLQQVEVELIEKQIKQHTDFEQQLKIQQDKIIEYEKQIQIIKSEYLVEIENNKLTHEQEKILLKQTLQTNSTSGNLKQMEYELTEARYKIEKLEKQIEINTNKDDRSTLESQINFLNDVIIDLKNTNDQLKKEIQFLKNPFIEDEEFSQNTTTTKVKSSAPRLFCDMCEVFDQHDTDDCPKQSSLIDEQPRSRERVLPPPRLYCEKCQEFDHDCNEIDETY